MTPNHSSQPDGASADIPLLTQPLPPGQLPAHLLAALDSLERDKQAFDALASELVAAMRPDIERLVTDLVHASLQKVWRERSSRSIPPHS